MEKDLELFVAGLYGLNHTLNEMFKTADLELLPKLNRQIINLNEIQSASETPALKAVDGYCKVIYSNFNMLVQVLRVEGATDDPAQMNKALNQFLRNIHTACVAIARQFGIVD